MINIITPCSRPENLLEMSNRIPVMNDLAWWIIFDSDKPVEFTLNYPPKVHVLYYKDDSLAGNGQRNYVLDIIKEGYIYFLDDDTLPHSGLFDLFKDVEDGKFYIGEQLNPDGSTRLKATMPELNHIDSGSCLIDRKIIGNNRWETKMYAGDGEFYLSVSLGNEDKIVLINKPISIYNALR